MKIFSNYTALIQKSLNFFLSIFLGALWKKHRTGLQKFDIKVSWSRQKVIMLYYNSCFFTMSVFCCRISSLFPLPLVFRAAHDNGTLQFNNFFKTYTCKFVLMRGENFDKIRLNPFQQKWNEFLLGWGAGKNTAEKKIMLMKKQNILLIEGRLFWDEKFSKRKKN